MAVYNLTAGIDLGNVNSTIVVRYMNPAGVWVAKELTIPSVVRWSKNKYHPIVNDPQDPSFPLTSAGFLGVSLFEAKSLLGKQCDDPDVSIHWGRWKQHIKNVLTGCEIEVPSQEGLTVSPGKACSLVLKELIKKANEYLTSIGYRKGITTVVLNIANQAQKLGLQEAALLAGVAISAFIVEPVAAILGSVVGIYNRPARQAFVVLDCGGRSLRAAVVRVNTNSIHIAARAEVRSKLASLQQWDILNSSKDPEGHQCPRWHLVYGTWFGKQDSGRTIVLENNLLQSIKSGAFVPTLNELCLLYSETLNKECRCCKIILERVKQEREALLENVIRAANLKQEENPFLVIHGGITHSELIMKDLQFWARGNNVVRDIIYNDRVSTQSPSHFQNITRAGVLAHGAAIFAANSKYSPLITFNPANTELIIPLIEADSPARSQMSDIPSGTTVDKPLHGTDYEALVEFLLSRGSDELWLDLLGEQNAIADKIWTALMEPRAKKLLLTLSFKSFMAVCDAATLRPNRQDKVKLLLPLINLTYPEQRYIQEHVLDALLGLHDYAEEREGLFKLFAGLEDREDDLQELLDYAKEREEALANLSTVILTCSSYRHATLMSSLLQRNLLVQISQLVNKLCAVDGSTMESVFGLLFQEDEEEHLPEHESRIRRLIGEGFALCAKYTEAMKAHTDIACTAGYTVLLDAIRAQDFSDWPVAVAYLQMVKRTVDDSRVASLLTKALFKLGRDRDVDNMFAAEFEEKLCAICHDMPKNVVLVPCGHLCICQGCSELGINDCPLCRQRVLSKIVVR
ncbi:hypothetical protein BV898_17471 [Hypsibius exemplaris]|uniref:RING-type domain-containing protein n=1 Tax=Hypsibius exemplaris TaxID=2072580 RepID=A0A9X6NFP3_HYPEX|nr:hypothetical protein BV898_17471 [Hypsibius exemplaris]